MESYSQWREQATHLYPDIVGNLLPLDESAYEAKVGVARSRVCDLDLLISAFDNLLEEASFLGDGHRIGESLVPVPQVSGQPDRGLSDALVRPCTIGQVNRHEGLVLFGGIGSACRV